jgi:dihydropyrimidinase
MQRGTLAIVGGQVMTPDGPVDGDVLTHYARIAAIAPHAGSGAAQVLDARGCLVLPGGVDPHAHALTDLPAVSRAAAHGGTTTILTFTLPDPGEPPVAAFVRARDGQVPDAAVDVGIHGSYLDPAHVPVRLLRQLRHEGMCGVQVFLAFPELGLMFDDGQLYRVLRDGAAVGIPVQVQCENGRLVAALTAELVAGGETAVRFYPRSRPGAVEDEAVARTLAIAALAGAPVYLVHLSTAIAVAQARGAKAQGARVTVEACTHHLLLDDSAYERADGARYVVGPPLRPVADVEALWEAIRDGTIDTVGSDHSHVPEPPAGPAVRFTEAPMGLPGIECRLPLVLSEGRRRGIPIGTLVEVLSAGPARAFGLYPQKGALAVGSDADVVIWDPIPSSVIRRATLHDGLGHSPYEGLAVQGAIRHTVVGGRVLGQDPTGGRFVSPARDHAAPPPSRSHAA